MKQPTGVAKHNCRFAPSRLYFFSVRAKLHLAFSTFYPIFRGMAVSARLLLWMGAGALGLFAFILILSKVARTIVRESLGFPAERSEITYTEAAPLAEKRSRNSRNVRAK